MVFEVLLDVVFAEDELFLDAEASDDVDGAGVDEAADVPLCDAEAVGDLGGGEEIFDPFTVLSCHGDNLRPTPDVCKRPGLDVPACRTLSTRTGATMPPMRQHWANLLTWAHTGWLRRYERPLAWTTGVAVLAAVVSGR